CLQDDSEEVPILRYRHYQTSKSLFILKLLYYARYLFALIFNTAIFFAAFFYLSPPANPEDIVSLGLLFVPIGAIFLASALGLYLEGRIEIVEVDIDSLLQDIDSYTLANHGFRAFDDEVY
ncbi:MAG: hypothetical protein J6N72_09075, partial [Psychrobacter sp.]|nr:hypothetical protein [Psychrobacter sp.]